MSPRVLCNIIWLILTSTKKIGNFVKRVIWYVSMYRKTLKKKKRLFLTVCLNLTIYLTVFKQLTNSTN